jgi:acyl-coenzyme A synthetase/AMP-(fatty) acid ligase
LTDRPGQFDSGLPEIQIDLQSLKNVSIPINKDILVANPITPWLLVIGSSTTGKPLLIPVTHAQENARSSMSRDWLGITSDDRITSLSHLDFTAPKHRLHEVLWAGASFGLFDRDTENPIQMCPQRSFTVLHATVWHVESMLATLPPDAANALDSLRILSMGASSVSDDLRQRIRRHLCSNLLVRYATNETGPIAIAGPSEVFAVSGTVGRPAPGVLIQIVDSSSQPVSIGTIGFIRVRSPGLIDGYFHDENTTRQRFKDNWFLPGDLGKLTQDGHLIYWGRADHMMIMGGINIYPAEIEEVLTGHPAVRDAAAMPVKNTILQDIPVCAVVLYSGADISEQSLLTYARERLGVQSPDRVAIIEKIPRNERGKLIRAELMEQITIKLGMTS